MDGENNMAIVISDAAGLRAAYPQLCAQIADEAVAEERARMKAIDEIARGIPEDVLMKARYDQPVSAADLALAQMKANNAAGQQFFNNMVSDMQQSGASAVGADPNEGYDLKSQKSVENAQKVSSLAAKLKADKRRR